MTHSDARKAKQLQNQKRKRTSERQLTYLVAGAAALFAVLIGLIIFVSIQRSQPIAGEVTVATLDNAHISSDRVVSVTYNYAFGGPRWQKPPDDEAGTLVVVHE